MKQFAKAILSSRALYVQLLNAFHLWDRISPDIEDYDDTFLVKFNIANRYLTVPQMDLSLNVEHRGECFTEVTVQQLKRLSKMLGAIEEQPISLSISDNDSWFHLSDIVI